MSTNPSRKLKWQVLPAAFRATDMMNLFGLTNEQTTKTLYRWIRDGHISRLSKRIDVYANNAKCEHAELRVPMMLKKLNPLSVYCGPSVLNGYSWSTQFTPLTYCMLPGLTKDLEIPESSVILLKRPHRWWKAMTPYFVEEGQSNNVSQRHLRPEALLAEALLTTQQHHNVMDLWAPDVDDLDFGEIDHAVTDEAWYDAFNTVARYYRKALPPPGSSKESWYEQVRHIAPPAQLPASEVSQAGLTMIGL